LDRGLAVILTALVGGLVALQAPINAQLGRNIGSLQAVTFSFFAGAALLSTIMVLSGSGIGWVSEVKTVPWYYLIGGMLGACYVTVVMLTVRTLGSGGITAATVSGQLLFALFIDQFAVAGVDKHPITLQRVVGVVLLAVGTLMVVND